MSIHDIFKLGPDVILKWLNHEEIQHSAEGIDIKLLADMAWTRASALEEKNPTLARQ